MTQQDEPIESFNFRSLGGKNVHVDLYTLEGIPRAVSTIDGHSTPIGEGASHETAIKASLGIVYGDQALRHLKQIREQREGQGQSIERKG